LDSFFSPLLSVAMVSAMLFSWFFCRIYDLTSIVAVPLLFHVCYPISIFCVYFRGFFKVIFFVVDFPWLNLSQFDFLYFLLSAGMFFQYFCLFCSCFFAVLSRSLSSSRRDVYSLTSMWSIHLFIHQFQLWNHNEND